MYSKNIFRGNFKLNVVIDKGNSNYQGTQHFLLFRETKNQCSQHVFTFSRKVQNQCRNQSLKKPCRGFYVSQNILPTSFEIDQIQNIIDIGS
jgi:hypothetical protein